MLTQLACASIFASSFHVESRHFHDNTAASPAEPMMQGLRAAATEPSTHPPNKPPGWPVTTPYCKRRREVNELHVGRPERRPQNGLVDELLIQQPALTERTCSTPTKMNNNWRPNTHTAKQIRAQQARYSSQTERQSAPSPPERLGAGQYRANQRLGTRTLAKLSSAPTHTDNVELCATG